jgi:release factor glutamine methyltransferase
VAVDVSEAALSVAAQNAATHGVSDRVRFAAGSWFGPVEGTFDQIVSNPPYITADAMAGLEAEVADYDPALALSGGADGLVAYREIVAQAGGYLVAGGRLMVEIGFDQGAAVRGLFEAAGFGDVAVVQDLAGLDRVVSGVA